MARRKLDGRRRKQPARGSKAAMVVREEEEEIQVELELELEKEKESDKGKKESDKGKEKEGEGEGEREAKIAVNKFFKVFIPSQSAERLKIPPSFDQYLQNEPTGMVSLKGPSGNTWYVELASVSTGLSFEKGWKEFIKDHSIVFGDLLIFRYDGQSQFSVLLFDCSGSEKLSAFHAEPCKNIVIKIEHDEEDIDTSAASPSEMLPLPIEDSNETTRKRIREIDDLMENGLPSKKSSDVLDKSKKKRDGSSIGTSRSTSTSPNITKGSPIIMSNNYASSDKNTKTACQNTKTAPMLLRMNKDVPRRGKRIQRGQRQLAIISQRRQVTEEEKNFVLQKAKRFKSKNPFAMQIMKASYVYVGFFMNMPCEFVREYLPRTSKKITLWDPQGKAWEVNYVYYSDRCVGSFSGGWGKFAVGNNLEMFDVCIFELFMKDNIKVHIYRVVPEITPYLPHSSKK